jgi:hypothetical protein
VVAVVGVAVVVVRHMVGIVRGARMTGGTGGTRKSEGSTARRRKARSRRNEAIDGHVCTYI